MKRRVFVAVICAGILAGNVWADIKNWQTGQTIPGTEYITPGPWMYLSNWNTTSQNLWYADFSGGLNLSGSTFRYSWLDYARFTGANLAHADFYSATLINADFSGATITQTNFGNTTSKGFTQEQLYSTDSYQVSDLRGIQLGYNDLTGWNFANQNLTGVGLYEVTLTSANLSGANLTSVNFGSSTLANTDFSGATVAQANFNETTGFAQEQLYSTSSYQIGDLQGIGLSGNDLTDWNFANQNLNGVDLRHSTLANADFSGATVAQTEFGNTTSRGFTKEQLYSTASYQISDLHGIGLYYNDLTDWGFVNQNLTGANLFSTTLANANFNGATVAQANFGNTTSNGFTQEQLYSTASYQAGDLHGIGLADNDLTGWIFANQNLGDAEFNGATLTNADFSGANLTDADIHGSTLTNANLSGANLTGAHFDYSTLTNTNFSGATVAGADFGSTTDSGFTQEQLYSTASYQVGDLHGMRLDKNNLTGWNFANQNLIDAYFHSATLNGANLSGANLTGADFDSSMLTNTNLSGAIVTETDLENTTSKGFTQEQLYSTASYQAGDLHGIGLDRNNLTGWNFANQNLTDADFYSSTLANADFSGANLTNVHFRSSTLTNTNFSDAIVTGADLSYTTSDGFTQEQLYSTASYQEGDLHGIGLLGNDLSGWNFSGQNLTGASFYEATLTSANLSGADTRGAYGLKWSGAISRNTIRQNGEILGLGLAAGEVLKVRDYDGGIGITILNNMQMADDAVLDIILADATWGSTVTLDSGIVPDLGGILNLDFAAGADAAALVGTTFDLFNWNGMLAGGDRFDQVVSQAGCQWDLSQLYTTGQVTLLSIPEPATMALLGLGAVMVRKRRK